MTEFLATFFFLFIIIGSTSKGAAAGFAGIPIGLGLTLIHLITIPVTNTSVNPARSTGPALFAGGAYISQLWLFWLAPLAGAVIAGLLARWLYEPESIAEHDCGGRAPRRLIYAPGHHHRACGGDARLIGGSALWVGTFVTLIRR